MLLLGILTVLAVGSPPLTVDFVNDYTPAAVGGIPPRAVYRRGSDVCCALVLAASEEPKAALSVVAGKTATFKTAMQVYTLLLQSPATQSVMPPKGRQVQLKVVYAGLPDTICSGTLTLPLQVQRGQEVVWEKIETQLFLVEARPFVPGVVDNLDILAEAVSYAEGKAGSADIATAIAHGLFQSGRFTYDDKKSVSAFDSATGTNRLGKLKPESAPLPVNCYQLSTYLGVLLGSLGIESELREIVLDHQATGEYAFQTAPAIAIGAATKQPVSYSVLSMFSHQYLLVDGKVYDCAYAPQRDSKGNPWGRAVTGWTVSEYLGETPGLGGSFVTGTPTGKQAKLRIERSEVPALVGSK